MFPTNQQQQIRAQLSFVLAGVVSQVLIPRADGPGRALALEIMVPNAAIRNLIRDDKVHQIYSSMQVGQDKFGMQTLNQALFQLYKRNVISLEEAHGHSQEPDELRMMIEGKGVAPAVLTRAEASRSYLTRTRSIRRRSCFVGRPAPRSRMGKSSSRGGGGGE